MGCSKSSATACGNGGEGRGAGLPVETIAPGWAGLTQLCSQPASPFSHLQKSAEPGKAGLNRRTYRRLPLLQVEALSCLVFLETFCCSLTWNPETS